MKGKRSSQATADFEGGFKSAGTTPKEAAADAIGQGGRNFRGTRDLGSIVDGGQFYELRYFMQDVRKENSSLLAACAAEKAVRAKSFFMVSTLQMKKAAWKKSIEELTRRLTEKRYC